MRAPAVPLCLALVAGVLSPGGLAPAYSLSLAALSLLGAIVGAARHHLRIGAACVLTAFFLFGHAAHTLHRKAVDESELALVYARFDERDRFSPRLVVGRLRSEPDSRAYATLLTVDVDQLGLGRRMVSARGGLRVSVRGEQREYVDALVSGDTIRFWASIREPAFFHNPGSFDGRGALERQHIDLLGSVKSGLLVERSTTSPGLSAGISRLRRATLARLEGELGSSRTFGIVAALVTGVRSDLSPELARLYQRAGIYHVMAISGAHVAIWTFFLHGVLRRLGLSRRTTLVLLLILLPFYAIFCGSRAPVVRAVVMASAFMGARLVSLKAPTENALALAAVGLLIWEPASVFDAGFQLTMAAMAGIVVFTELLAERLTWVPCLARPLAVSVAAQLGVVPVAAWHFHRLSLAAPFASLAAIPVAAVICILGVTLVLVAGVPVLSAVAAAGTRLAVTSLTFVAETVSQLPAASVRVAAPSWLFVLIYGAALFALRSSSRRLRMGGIVLLGALLAVALAPFKPATGNLEVTALDVGHGDAIVLTLPRGRTVLVDGGGLALSALDIGERIVLPYLLDSGVRKIDAIVITHADYDHIGGLLTIVTELRVEEIWQGNPDRERPAYRALRARADEHDIPVRALRTGEQFTFGGARFQVLEASDDRGGTSNDRSVVLRVGYAGRWVLLTGDAEAALENRLVRSRRSLKADVLKLAHHGSRSSTSESFLDAVEPEFAIVSARENRARPIPSPIVLERLEERGIEYARTDHTGAITVRIRPDGEMEVSTYRRGKTERKDAKSRTRREDDG